MIRMRLRGWLLAVIGLLAAVLTPAVSAAIFGQDDRRTLDGQLATLYSGVGVVHAPAPGATGTGALVWRNDLVVTAAHLFFAGGQLRAPLAAYQFIPGDVVTGSLAPYRVTEVYTMSGQPFGLDGADDVAVLRLDRPVNGGAVPLGLPSDPEALNGYRGEAALVAYHADLGARTPMITPCRIRDRVSFAFFWREHPLMYHDCDSAGQSSGGPIVVLENGWPVLGGVHSGHHSQRDFQPFDADYNYGLAVRVNQTLVQLIRSIP
ncbi:MAG: serine protease [Azospirillaceae bacterium]